MTTSVVFGAGGATGQECVKRLLEVGSGPVRAVVRDPTKYADAFPSNPRLEVTQGDVTDIAACKRACSGAGGVIYAASGKGYWSPHAVDYEGVKNVANAAKEANAQRVVLVSSRLVTDKNRWNPMRIMLNNFRYSLMDYKFKGEQALRASGVSYTIVRPGGLHGQPGGVSTLITGQGDNAMAGGRAISRADVAAVCVEALSNPAAHRVTLELAAAPPAEGAPPAAPLKDQLSGLWKGLVADP